MLTHLRPWSYPLFTPFVPGAVGYFIGWDVGLAQQWYNHKNPKEAPWKVRHMVTEVFKVEGVSDLDTKVDQEYHVYGALFWAKHANPMFQRHHGVDIDPVARKAKVGRTGSGILAFRFILSFLPSKERSEKAVSGQTIQRRWAEC